MKGTRSKRSVVSFYPTSSQSLHPYSNSRLIRAGGNTEHPNVFFIILLSNEIRKKKKKKTRCTKWLGRRQCIRPGYKKKFRQTPYKESSFAAKSLTESSAAFSVRFGVNIGLSSFYFNAARITRNRSVNDIWKSGSGLCHGELDVFRVGAKTSLRGRKAATSLELTDPVDSNLQMPVPRLDCDKNDEPITVGGFCMRTRFKLSS